MNLLQVCNVGNICGGTAACAWTITRAFPEWSHTVIFLSRPSDETRTAFSGCDILQKSFVEKSEVQRLNPDVVILHNISKDRCAEFDNVTTIQYHHSTGIRATADRHVACSNWLAEQLQGQIPVLYQAVPIPNQPEVMASRELSDELVIGRICSPQLKKWPIELIDLYEQLATQHPHVAWEFVGAPASLQNELQRACKHKATFTPAGFSARQRIWNWHALLYHHPALTESFGRTVAEAMRSGCVPIVDSRGGFCEQIMHQKTGFLCRHADDFASAIEAISKPNQWWQLSQTAGTVANMRFSISQMRESLLKVFMNC